MLINVKILEIQDVNECQNIKCKVTLTRKHIV